MNFTFKTMACILAGQAIQASSGPTYCCAYERKPSDIEAANVLLILHGPEPTSEDSAHASTAQKPLVGSVSELSSLTMVREQIDLLLDKALDGNKDFGAMNQAVAHYSSKKSAAMAKTKEAVNYMVPYRGCGPSRKAADVILDEPVDPDDRESAAYGKQRVVDETHPLIVRSVLKIADALGSDDSLQREKKITEAKSELADLVGQQAADSTVSLIGQISESCVMPEDMTSTSDMDLSTRDDLIAEITNLAMAADPVVAHLKKRLHKYSDHSVLAEKFSGLVQGSMSLLTWLGPGFLIPTAAEAVNTSYVMATGGNEEDKLLKSVFFDKRLESRWRAINREAALSVNAHEQGLRKKNKPLLVCSKAICVQLVGEDKADTLGLNSTESPQSVLRAPLVQKTEGNL